MKILAITQARYGSTRLHAKILKEVNGVSLLELHLRRILKSKLIDKLKVATTNEEGSKYIIEIAKKLNVDYYQGSVNDVLERFYKTAEPEHPDIVVRFTSDCPLIDPEVIDKVIRFMLDNDYDYVATDSKSFPDGLDTEVFKFAALKKAYTEATLSSEREHVTPYIWKNGTGKNGTLFKTAYFTCPKGDYSDYRITIDTIEDFQLLQILIQEQGFDKSWLDYINFIKTHTDLSAINNMHKRNEGYEKSLNNDCKISNINIMGKGQELYKKAKTIIPGGNMLLSKRPEMFLPENWPSYFSKAKGCRIWDLDGKEYIDCTIMGIGTNTLGYGREEVDEAVMRVVKNGNMSTFNCPEEVELAEKLLELDPWAGMVRFARTGGEINAVTVRIARAAAKKDKIAICGYHGWHDWYLSANLANDKNLDGQLLPGLKPAGVPKVLTGQTIPFFYNDFEGLLEIVNHNDLAAIKMEVSRNMGPQNNFLQKIRQLCNERGIILIFDECTSGFRETFGGLYKKYGVEPDMAIYSKTIGNGYAISAVVGKTEIMQAAQDTFISSTFWTERIGPTAALATLKVMEKERSWEKITAIGLENKRRWQEIADRHGVSIRQWGIPALAGFTYNSPNNLAYKTYVTQEMLKKGYLVGNSMYTCLAHTPDVLEGYFYELDKLFATIREFEDGRDVMKELEGPVCQTGFQRLN